VFNVLFVNVSFAPFNPNPIDPDEFTKSAFGNAIAVGVLVVAINNDGL